jgi:small GTP-binding protein
MATTADRVNHTGNNLYRKVLRPPPLPSAVLVNFPARERKLSTSEISNNTPEISTCINVASKLEKQDQQQDTIDDQAKTSSAHDEPRSTYSISSAPEGLEIDRTMKLLVVGNSKCGKSSIIARFALNDFKENYKTTIGADFIRKDLLVRSKEDKEIGVRLQLWDIAGQDRFQKLTRAYFSNARGVVIVCDVSREGTVNAVRAWKHEINNWAENIPVILFANKADLLSNPKSAFETGATMERSILCVSYFNFKSC